MPSQQKAPTPPNYAQLLKQGSQINLQQLPSQLAAELGFRQQYDPQYIAQQQALQSQFGPTQYGQQLAARSQLDPLGTATYNALQGNAANYLRQGALNPQQAAAYAQYGQMASQAAAQGGWTPEQALAYKTLGQNVTSNLLQGTQADPTSLQEMGQVIRSRQGPYASGNAPAMAEAVYVGQRAQQLQQQRQGAATAFGQLQNPAGQAAQGLQTFASMQTPQAQAMAAGMGAMSARNPMTDVLGIQGVQAPVANQFVNPNAGAQAAQFGLSNYQNLLGAQALNQSNNPWTSALGGAASGAAAGTTISPGYGTAIGAVAGGLSGYFSDRALKENISRTGTTTRDGIPIVTFNFKGFRKRWRGVIAQEVMKIRPDAVLNLWGLLAVKYDLLGIRLEEA